MIININKNNKDILLEAIQVFESNLIAIKDIKYVKFSKWQTMFMN